MVIKNISTRMIICGRTAKCTGDHSAVEQSGYISREIMYSEYDCKTYYPKYAEDLVHNEVLLFQCPFLYKNGRIHQTASCHFRFLVNYLCPYSDIISKIPHLPSRWCLTLGCRQIHSFLRIRPGSPRHLRYKAYQECCCHRR